LEVSRYSTEAHVSSFLWRKLQELTRALRDFVSFRADDTSDLFIPAIFVSRSTFLFLRDELVLSTLPAPGGLEIRLYEDLGWEWPLLDLLLLLLLLPSLLTLATLTLHHFRLAQ